MIARLIKTKRYLFEIFFELNLLHMINQLNFQALQTLQNALALQTLQNALAPIKTFSKSIKL